MAIIVAVESASGENCWIDCYPDPAYILVDESTGEMLSHQAYTTQEEAEAMLKQM